MDKKNEIPELNLDKLVSNGEVSPITTLAIMINNKHDKLIELEKQIKNETNLQLTYLHKYNDKLLNTDFKAATGESRPTVAMKEAWIQEQLQEDYDNLKIAETKTKIIKKEMDLLNDRIRLEEYLIKLELK